MSDIDLKALRETIEACIRTDRRFPVFTASDVLQLIDRLEAAEKERDELRTDADRLDWMQVEVDGFANIDRITSVSGLFNGVPSIRHAIDAAMAQEGGK